MNVKQLIAELKKMPGNLDVHVAAHDNHEWESQGMPHGVWHHAKRDFDEFTRDLCSDDRQRLDDMPDEWVILAC